MARQRRKGGRVTPKGTRPSGSPTGGYGERPVREPSFVDDAGRQLRERSPFGLLSLASSLIEATTERQRIRLREGPTPPVGVQALIESFINSELPETEALALAMAALHPDEVLARRLKDRIRDRGSVMRHPPPWLESMGQMEVTDVAELVETLRDGDDVMVAWRWPNGSAATAVVYIDHNMGTVVKDAFVIPEPFEAVKRTYHRTGLKDQELRSLDPAAARTRITDAIAVGDRFASPLESDTWPMCRPMVEWMLRALPAGGEGYERPHWGERQRERLLTDFLASPFARAVGLPARMMRDLADPLVWFGCDYGPGDPLRWSAVSVEIVLVDWYPRKVFGIELDVMQRVPDVVEAFVRFAHDQRQVPADLTDDAVASVARWTPDFLQAVARPGRSPEANAVRLARIAAGLDPDEFDDDEWEADDEASERAAALDEFEWRLIAEAGGPEAYAALTDDPLPDEPFDWSKVPEQFREATAATLARLDQLAIDLCDIEVRTAGRRMLAALAAGDTGVFRRSIDTDRLAVAMIWSIARRLAIHRGLPGFKLRTCKQLSGATGMPASAISSRALTVETRLDAADFDWSLTLHSSRRRGMLRSRQIIADGRQRYADGD